MLQLVIEYYTQINFLAIQQLAMRQDIKICLVMEILLLVINLIKTNKEILFFLFSPLDTKQDCKCYSFHSLINASKIFD